MSFVLLTGGAPHRSVNVCGCKRWRLLPPEHTHLLYDRFGRELAPDFCDRLDTTRAEQFPNLAAAQQHIVEVIQVTMLSCRERDSGAEPCLGYWHFSLRTVPDPMEMHASLYRSISQSGNLQGKFLILCCLLQGTG